MPSRVDRLSQPKVMSPAATSRWSPPPPADVLNTWLVNRIRELAPRHPDSQVAELLDQENLTPGASDSFTESKVQWIRYAYDIPTGCPVRPSACPNGQRGDGRYSAQAAAELLNVNISTIAAWCKSGRLDGIQAMPRSPWWVKLTPDIIAGLRKPVRRRWSLRSTA